MRLGDKMSSEHHATIFDAFAHLADTPTDKITAGVAGAAILSPTVLSSLRDFSEVAALFAPILGVVWLLVQIAVKLIELRKDGDSEE